ncbi:hypothetical protein DFH11DRAFT_1773908 [Phellopilus nigrolimitatus]|nr:hypothetical protein DFH11DRAFT_1773908 [Phellopilus nigrolimitatus]
MFDGTLNWEFVATNTDSAAQIFAYFPACLQAALGVTSDQVKVFDLQVWEPSTYTSAADASQLRTLFISYIPSDKVTELEQAVMVRQSDLYTGTSGISNQLAQRTRLDAIIGVCSALGGIALCILVFLIYRNFKRRQEVAHQRLTDTNPGGTPAPGQHFDQDLIGGQRRCSFYYAVQAPMHDEAAGIGGGMRERRAIVPGTISTPILRDNTLNW